MSCQGFVSRCSCGFVDFLVFLLFPPKTLRNSLVFFGGFLEVKFENFISHRSIYLQFFLTKMRQCWKWFEGKNQWIRNGEKIGESKWYFLLIWLGIHFVSFWTSGSIPCVRTWGIKFDTWDSPWGEHIGGGEICFIKSDHLREEKKQIRLKLVNRYMRPEIVR